MVLIFFPNISSLFCTYLKNHRLIKTRQNLSIMVQNILWILQSETEGNLNNYFLGLGRHKVAMSTGIILVCPILNKKLYLTKLIGWHNKMIKASVIFKHTTYIQPSTEEPTVSGRCRKVSSGLESCSTGSKFSSFVKYIIGKTWITIQYLSIAIHFSISIAAHHKKAV